MVFFIFIQILIVHWNSGEPDQMQQNAVSDLDLCCLHVSHKKEARLIRVNNVEIISNCILQDMLLQTFRIQSEVMLH